MKQIAKRACCLGVMVLGCLYTAQAQAPPQSGQEAETLQKYVSLLREDVNKQKVDVITQVMKFTPEQASKFWPIYTEYSKELAKIGDERVAGIKDYAANYTTMTDQKADELVTKAMGIETKRTALKSSFYNKVKQAMGGKVAARALQVENQLLMITDLQVASSLPFVE